MRHIFTIGILISIVGSLAVAYSVKDAWMEYKDSVRSGGWRLVAASSLLRAQIVRMVEGAFLALTVIAWIMYPDPPPDRPIVLTVFIRICILGALTLISVNAILDVKARREVFKYK